MTSQIRDAILALLEQNNEVSGTEQLALSVNTAKHWTIKCVRIMNASGQIQIIHAAGGRGHRTVYKINRTVCKINRNQPGLPRKRTR